MGGVCLPVSTGWVLPSWVECVFLCLPRWALPSWVLQVGSLKSSALGGASGEFLLDELPKAAKAAGWSVEPQRVPLSAGDKKPVTVR